jgi:hypothetical protein
MVAIPVAALLVGLAGMLLTRRPWQRLQARESRFAASCRFVARKLYEAARKRRVTNAAAVAIPASAAVNRFVWTHVRQALQQVVAAGAMSAYFAAVCVRRPFQTVCMKRDYPRAPPGRTARAAIFPPFASRLPGVGLSALQARHHQQTLDERLGCPPCYSRGL